MEEKTETKELRQAKSIEEVKSEDIKESIIDKSITFKSLGL
jgi:hypothetical protein